MLILHPAPRLPVPNQYLAAWSPTRTRANDRQLAYNSRAVESVNTSPALTGALTRCCPRSLLPKAWSKFAVVPSIENCRALELLLIAALKIWIKERGP